jgi:hypothetical protein
VGGYNDTDGAINTGATQAYDLIGDAWTSGPDLGTPRADMALAATSSALYAIGGDGPGPDFFEPTAIAERLPTGTWPGGAWATIDALPIASQSGTAGYCTLGVGSAGAEVWAVGGLRGDTFSIDGLTYWREAAGEGCPTIRSDVPWLSVDPLAGTVPGDGAGQVNVRIDTAGLEPGVHVATLLIPRPNRDSVRCGSPSASRSVRRRSSSPSRRTAPWPASPPPTRHRGGPRRQHRRDLLRRQRRRAVQVRHRRLLEAR